MAYASQISPSPQLRLPPMAMPKLTWPRLSSPLLSGRARALLMMGLMISPAFLSDYIGYGVKRLSYTNAQIVQMRAADDTMLSRVEMFPVACADPAAPAAEQRPWTSIAARNGWPMYPQAGETCFRPNRTLLGVAGLKTFAVACPTLALSVADREQWMHYASDRGWTAYPQAGTDCVDP
jgi:hypothetical protein